MKASFNYALVKEKMKELKITQQELADYLTKNGSNTSLDTIKSWFRSNKKTEFVPDSSKLALIGKLLKLNANDLFLGFENDEKTIKINYYPEISASAGYGSFNDDNSVEVLNINAQFAFNVLGLNYKKTYDMIKIKGDSMEPLLRNGDFVVIDTDINTLQSVANNDIVIFRRDDSLYCKRLLKPPFENYIILKSESSEYKDTKVYYSEFETCQIIGRVKTKFSIEVYENIIASI